MVLMEKMASCGKESIQAEMVALTVLSSPVSTALSPNIGEGNDHPLQYSCLGNPMDKEAWWATVREVAKRYQKDQTECAHMYFL